MSRDIENMLIDLLDTLGTEEFDELAADIELPPDKGAAKRITRRILGKERINMSNGIRKKTAATVIVIAAALGTAIAAGAAGYRYFAHKDTVDKSFGEGAGDVLEEKGLLDGEVIEGRHFNITKDAVLSTGEQMFVMLTIEPNDDEGIAIAERQTQIGWDGGALFEELEKQGCFMGGAGGGMTFPDENDPTAPMTMSINIDIDRQNGRDAEAEIPIYRLYAPDEEHKEIPDMTDEEKAERLIASVPISTKVNVEYKRLTADDGTELMLCDFCAKCSKNLSFHEWTDEVAFVVEYTDGSSEQVLGNAISGYSWSGGAIDENGDPVEADDVQVYYKATFNRLFESDRIAAVTLDGIRFTAE